MRHYASWMEKNLERFRLAVQEFGGEGLRLSDSQGGLSVRLDVHFEEGGVFPVMMSYEMLDRWEKQGDLGGRVLGALKSCVESGLPLGRRTLDLGGFLNLP